MLPFPHSQKPMYNFPLPQNLTINILLLTGNLTSDMNSQLMHSFYVQCFMYYILTIIPNFFLTFWVFLGYILHL